MQFYINTRTVNSDFGWFPAGNVFEEYVEKETVQAMTLVQENGQWNLACTFGSNRIDHMGRKVRHYLVISGDKNTPPPWGMLYYFLTEEFCLEMSVKYPEGHSKLRDHFDAKFEPLDNIIGTYIPNKLNNLGGLNSKLEAHAKKEIYESIFGDFTNNDWSMTLPAEFIEEKNVAKMNFSSHWIAPLDRNNLFRFIDFCEELFTGKREGIAIFRLSNNPNSWKDLQKKFDSYNNFAVLVPENSGIRTYTELTSETIHIRKPRVSRQKPSFYDDSTFRPKSSPVKVPKKKALWVLTGIILLILLISLKNCGSSERTLQKKSKESLTSSTTQITTTKTQNNNNKK